MPRVKKRKRYVFRKNIYTTVFIHANDIVVHGVLDRVELLED